MGASKGAKKSTGSSVPSGWTSRCTTDSPNVAGGSSPGVGVLGEPPLPVTKKRDPGSSDIRPTPDCQIPAPPLLGALSTQREVTWPAVETPNTHPCQVS